jgi:hypothetical protein
MSDDSQETTHRQPISRKAIGVTCAIMKLEIHAADEVMAVPFARIAVLMISTG